MFLYENGNLNFVMFIASKYFHNMMLICCAYKMNSLKIILVLFPM